MIHLYYHTAPIFFEKTNNNFSAVLDNGFGPSINRSIQMVKNNWYKNIDVNWDTYFNSGFIVYNKNHLNVFKEIQNFYLKSKTILKTLIGLIDSKKLSLKISLLKEHS